MNNRVFAVALIMVLTASALSVFESAEGATMLSVPDFSLRYENHSYYVEPTYGVDQFTGERVKTGGDDNVFNNSVVLTIKNPAFTPYTDADGNRVGLYYNVSWRGHFGGNWTYYSTHFGHYIFDYNAIFDDEQKYFLESSYSSETVLVFGLYSNDKSAYYDGPIWDVTEGGQVDFRVQAFTAYFVQEQSQLVGVPAWKPYYTVFNLVSESSWSNVKTVTIGNIQASPPPVTETPVPQIWPSDFPSQFPPATITPSNTHSELFGLGWMQVALAVLVVVVAGLVVGMVVLWRKVATKSAATAQSARET